MQERRLAAIMHACHSISRSSIGRFTDIVGYTTLMGANEDHAFEVLRKNHEIHSKLIDQFNGTPIKEIDDMVSIIPVKYADRCARTIQYMA